MSRKKKQKPNYSASLRRLLLAGVPLSQAAIRLGIGVKWARELAARQSLPTNPPIKHGGTVEAKVRSYYSSHTLNQTAARFRHTPNSIAAVIDKSLTKPRRRSR